jgi:deoxycytidine triphosphate deaminase
MALLLSDNEIKLLLGTVIVDGDINSVRPNSYILRLGSKGEYINANKEFELGKGKKGIRVPPGHAVAITAFETLDFRRETIAEFFPNNDLYAMVSPTTDLSREGIVAPSTHIDSGYFGTLNWTINNTSNEERRFLYKERIFRLVIFKLENNERPTKPYDGDYQGETGYVRSKRQGAPVGMKDAEWEDVNMEGSPESLLDNLVKSGYPWHALGSRLKTIDMEFKQITNEYSEIQDSLADLNLRIKSLDNKHNDFTTSINDVVKETIIKEANALQTRWLLDSGTLVAALIGITLAVTSNEVASGFVDKYGTVIGLIILLIALVMFIKSRPNQQKVKKVNS